MPKPPNSPNPDADLADQSDDPAATVPQNAVASDPLAAAAADQPAPTAAPTTSQPDPSPAIEVQDTPALVTAQQNPRRRWSTRSFALAASAAGVLGLVLGGAFGASISSHGGSHFPSIRDGSRGVMNPEDRLALKDRASEPERIIPGGPGRGLHHPECEISEDGAGVRCTWEGEFDPDSVFPGHGGPGKSDRKTREHGWRGDQPEASDQRSGKGHKDRSGSADQRTDADQPDLGKEGTENSQSDKSEPGEQRSDAGKPGKSHPDRPKPPQSDKPEA